MEYKIREMTSDDYESALALWKACKGVGLSASDAYEPVSEFIKKNPGLCYICEKDSMIAGTILCGFDGRRAYIYHLAVDDRSRRMGIGTALVKKVIDTLKDMGVIKCDILIFADNEGGIGFWKSYGFNPRGDLKLYQTVL